MTGKGEPQKRLLVLTDHECGVVVSAIRMYLKKALTSRQRLVRRFGDDIDMEVLGGLDGRIDFLRSAYKAFGHNPDNITISSKGEES